MRIRKTSQYIEGGAGLPSYFTTETNTGMKWIDGKPIYRRVFSGTFTSGDTLLTGVSKITNLSGWAFLSNRQRALPFSLYFDNKLFTVVCDVNSSNTLTITIISEGSTTSCSAEVVVEYTKTTD